MTTNPYFNFYTSSNEQSVLENLIIESIKAYGFDTYYLPKTPNDIDEIFRESTVNTFDTALQMEVYLKDNLKFSGDGKFMSQHLGLEIRDQTTFTVTRKRFEEEAENHRTRPLEGDLLYLPLDKKLYEIRFVEHQDVFYQLGKLMVYDLQCELLEYTGQKFNTGIADIDAITSEYDYDEEEENVLEDWIDQSAEIQNESDQLIDFSEKDPFAQGGTF